MDSDLDAADTADIDAQIAALQDLRAKVLAKAERTKREKEAEEAKVLVGSTPTKTKPGEPRDCSVSGCADCSVYFFSTVQTCSTEV